jgi:hypothetical protein
LPELLSIKCKGTWYPYPADEAQVERNIYCRDRLPALCAQTVAEARRPWFSGDFKAGLLIGAGGTLVVVVGVTLAVLFAH